MSTMFANPTEFANSFCSDWNNGKVSRLEHSPEIDGSKKRFSEVSIVKTGIYCRGVYMVITTTLWYNQKSKMNRLTGLSRKVQRKVFQVEWENPQEELEIRVDHGMIDTYVIQS